MGGVTGPKRITCIGSDGHSYNQLVKKDDVRQDAVFMNVFGVINDLLHTNVATRQRRLSIRTYKVIPISIDTGVLEWVDGSIPLGSWLQKAHPRYHPTDYAPEHCRKMMTSVREETAARKAAMLRKILGNFHPVLRHFFEETYQDPQEWFERRNAYTTSVATMSIVGWIVGALFGRTNGQKVT